MKCEIIHESKGRIRVHIIKRSMTLWQADSLADYLGQIEGVTKAVVYERTCNAVVHYDTKRDTVIKALSTFCFNKEKAASLITCHSGRGLNRRYQEMFFKMVMMRFVRKLFIPAPVNTFLTVIKGIRYVLKGLKCLLRGKLEIEVLDAAAIFVSLLRGNYDTAGSVMFLLGMGELLEEWTHKKSVDDLARSMALNVDKVWTIRDGEELQVPIMDINVGDPVSVRAGNLIPLDGVVISGEAMVNQSALTGEPLSKEKREGAYVYAGTVVETGQCVIRVEKLSGANRYDKIVTMIENSERLKSSAENRALSLAKSLVPFSLIGTAAAFLFTSSLEKALSILMVDFSCALKLSMPLSVLSAMREAGEHGITVKGGAYLEAVSKADTLVFDKTGTLTIACPAVERVVPFGGRQADDVLRIAACLEEHYPHSMANAVVREAINKNISHSEMHARVEYVVAHGISSTIEGEKVIIGSHHFVFEDEGVDIPEGEKHKFDALPPEYSHLYLAAGGELAGVILISDPLRPEAEEVIEALNRLGIEKIVMMTGDNERTARAVAEKVGIKVFYAEVLPEDKARFVESERAANRTVVMIGDGINDSPALSASNAGIAMREGAALAREISDITISADNLYELVILKRLSDGLMRRISANYSFIMLFNAGLILLGLLGVITPSASAMLHNVSTLGVSLKSMTNLLK